MAQGLYIKLQGAENQNQCEIISELLAARNTDEVQAKLIQSKQAAMITILTYGFLNTQIINNETKETRGVVTVWPDHTVTVCQTNADNLALVDLVHVTDAKSLGYVPDADQSVKLFEEIYNNGNQ